MICSGRDDRIEKIDNIPTLNFASFARFRVGMFARVSCESDD
jgi:hypothetical protein